ncbi:DUF55-domain-containing protein [Panus rudis PR-1116 ss-1]|nr:DUF55-domain-containing protein [Panus rudis PR-1116 ss-1]
MASKHWLMKAEPDSRIVKGKDVKFSVDDFEAIGTTPWEGVRNAEARNLIKEMRVGDKVLFYHSNCKNPGIAAFAEVSKEAYPDYTAWDSEHPYFDAKTDKSDPKWYMVDVTFKSRAKHFIPLSLIKHLASLSGSSTSLADPPEEVAYIGRSGMKAIREMALVNRGRLSVQRVEENAWKTMQLLAENGGWDDMNFKGKVSVKPSKGSTAGPGKEANTKKAPRRKTKEDPAAEPGEERSSDQGDTIAHAPVPTIEKTERGRKRKADDADVEAPQAVRRSTRVRR